MFEKRISGKTQVTIVNELFKETEVYLLKTIGQLMGTSSGLTDRLDPDQIKLINDALSYWANIKKLCSEYIQYNENEKELLNERLDRQDKLLEEISKKLEDQNELIEKLSQKKDK